MRITFSLFFGAWALCTFTGCADLLSSLREESAAIDREADRDRDREEDADRDADYRPRRPLNGVSANNVASMDPPVRRGYGRRLANLDDGNGGGYGGSGGGASYAAPPEYRRVTRGDFVDKASNENSLWDGQGQNNFLFSHNRVREPGDMVTVEVEKELKREIQYQLWMTLPPEQRRPKRAPASAKTADGATKPADGAAAPAAAQAEAAKPTEEKNRDAAEEAAKTNLASGGKEDDIVRMEVAENLGNGLSRVVGQKRVIYRGVSRVVEVVALVNNKDIDDSGRVKSSSFLDMKTQVIQ